MPFNQTEFLSAEEIEEIHNTSMAIMANVGIRFADDETVNTFKRHGFKVVGNIVYITESQVRAYQLLHIFLHERISNRLYRKFGLTTSELKRLESMTISLSSEAIH